MLGLCPKKDNAYNYNVYTSISILISTIVCVDILSQTIEIFFILDDLSVLSAAINTLPEKYIAIAKAYQLTLHAKEFRHIIQEINTQKFQPVNSAQFLAANKCLKMFKLIFISFSSSVVGTIFLGILFPILDKTEEKNFFAQAWYPYDSKISPFYEITYGYQCISIYIIGGIVISVDSFICFQHIFIGCQFDLLCNKLKHTTEDNIYNCIKQHHQILRFFKPILSKVW